MAVLDFSFGTPSRVRSTRCVLKRFLEAISKIEFIKNFYICDFTSGQWQKWNFFEHSCAWECQSIYEPVCEFFFWNFLKFFQKLPSAHIFINCTNLSKFVKLVKIVFDSYLNFIKLANISKIFGQARAKFKFFCICKVYTNSFIIYRSFLNMFSMILKFPRSFPEYSSNFFFISTNITQNEYLFLIFAVLSRQFLNPLLTFCQVFGQIPQFFFSKIKSA